MCFSHYLDVGGGGLPRGLGHNLLMQFSGLSSSNMEIYETDFFDTLTIQNHQISYAKHVLAPLYVFFTLFWCWGVGGAPKGSRAQPAFAIFQPQQLKNGRLSPLFKVPCRRQQNCRCVGYLVTLEKKFDFVFFQNPCVACGPGSGDHVVTIRVLEHPWGPTWWPLGLCRPSQGPPKSFKIAACR